MSGLGLQSLVAVLLVLALVAALAWLARRGAFNALSKSNRHIVVETAVPLGERRSLVVVAVEGRRLLLGLTPSQISLVTELAAVPPEPPADRQTGGSFDRQLLAKARSTFLHRESTVAARQPVVAPFCGSVRNAS